MGVLVTNIFMRFYPFSFQVTSISAFLISKLLVEMKYRSPKVKYLPSKKNLYKNLHKNV